MVNRKQSEKNYQDKSTWEIEYANEALLDDCLKKVKTVYGRAEFSINKISE